MLIAIAIVIILLVAAVTILLTASRRRATTGTLSRETRSRDQSADAPEDTPPAGSTSTELEATGRTRSDDTRQMAGEVATRDTHEIVRWEPVDEEEIGVSRRQFLNRAVLGVTGFSASVLGIGVLGFLWPTGASGFGGQIRAGNLDDILAEIDDKRQPFYVPSAKTYLNPYPADAIPNAENVQSYAPVLAGMEQGIVALYQRCVHLGCRVPWCQSSQWFECPCHGSKYNAVGEKRDGPAPRGLDRFVVQIDGGSVVIDTGTIVNGPPIGTNTTEQSQEGPSCI